MCAKKKLKNVANAPFFYLIRLPLVFFPSVLHSSMDLSFVMLISKFNLSKTILMDVICIENQLGVIMYNLNAKRNQFFV